MIICDYYCSIHIHTLGYSFCRGNTYTAVTMQVNVAITVNVPGRYFQRNREKINVNALPLKINKGEMPPYHSS